MLSTFVIGHLASEAGGRFGAGTLDPRGRRGQLPGGDLPGHRALAEWLDGPVDWEAEYRADLDDLRRMIAGMAEQAAGPAEGPEWRSGRRPTQAGRSVVTAPVLQ